MLFFKKGLFLSLFALSACGFVPLYHTPNGEENLQHITSSVQIVPVQGENGRLLIQCLKNNLNPKGLSISKEYFLSLTLNETINKNQGILKDNTASRTIMTLKAFYTLKDKNGRVLLDSSSSIASSYDILAQPYSSVTAEATTRQNLIKVLADNISLHIANSFKILTNENKTISN